MAFLQVNQISRAYPDMVLFQNLSFSLEEQERVGLVGINGCGKTTLLRILAGLEQPDRGSVQLADGCQAGLLRQDPDPAEDVAALAENEYESERLDRISRLGLRTECLERPNRLSGGERTRLALGRFLAARPDLLLLDEPTNNMDLPGIRATIRMLSQYRGCLLIVSHDRYFLDQTVSRILELEQGHLTSYSGHYSAYREEKQRRFQAEMHRYQDGVREQKRIEAAIQQSRQWADKAHRMSTEKDQSGLSMGVKEKKRVKARKLDRKAKNDQRRLERQRQDLGDKPREERALQFAISQSRRQGRRILEAADLAKGYAGRSLFRDSYFYVQRNEKVAVYGPNACGKTTLVRLMQQSEQPDSGRIWISSSCRPYYLNQNIDDLPAGISLGEFLQQRVILLDGRVRAVLDQMGFSQAQLALPLQQFSLGERMKIKLLEPILGHKDFLILDEPTNYLDLHARETLEKALQLYDGTLLVISHDLYLLQAVCDKVLLFGENQIRRLEDSFAQYLEKSALLEKNQLTDSR